MPPFPNDAERSGRKAHRGYGLAILLVFLMTMLVAQVSVQMTLGSTQANLSRSVREKTQARAVATAAFPAVKAYMDSQLELGTPMNAGFQWLNQSIVTPTNPNNLGGGTTTIELYDMTIVRRNGNFYTVRVDATSGVGRYSETRLLVMKDPLPPLGAYSCAVVEAEIAAGRIARLPNAYLTQYAQNGCMIKAGDDAVTTLAINPITATVGSGSNCNSGSGSSSGTGTLNFGNVSNCNYQANSYPVMQFNNLISNGILRVNLSNGASTAINLNRINDAQLRAGNGAQTVAIATYAAEADIQLGNGTNDLSIGSNLQSNSFVVLGSGANTVRVAGTMNDSQITSNGPATFRLNSVVEGNINSSSVAFDDVVSVLSSITYNSTILTGGGNDFFTIGGAVDDSVIYTGAGQDILHLTNIQGAAEVYAQGGNDAVYFRRIIYNSVIDVGDGDDLVACNKTMGAGSCTTVDDSTIFGGAGNDIIAIDGTVVNGATIYDTSGYNIVYLKACNTNGTVVVGPKSLVISAGNRNDCTITGGGGNSVVLLLTGTTTVNGATVAGFTRTLNY